MGQARRCGRRLMGTWWIRCRWVVLRTRRRLLMVLRWRRGCSGGPRRMSGSRCCCGRRSLAVGRRETPAHERFAVLWRAADLVDERAEDIAQTLSAESGKPITEARGEAGRSGAMIRLAAFEGSQLDGSALPLDANPGTVLEKIGFTMRQPCGIIVAISPFNFPALTVLHKIAPALAAGNAVVLKPARSTPLTALKLAQCFVDAGLAPGALSVLTGSGGKLGDRLVADPRGGKGTV